MQLFGEHRSYGPMKLTFLGTAAAEGMPALWCECPTCAEAKKLGGKEIRRRCSYLLDGDTLIDFGPDAFCLLYTSPSPRDRQKSRMPSSA